LSGKPGAGPRGKATRWNWPWETFLASAIVASLAYLAWVYPDPSRLPPLFTYHLHAPMSSLYETAYWANNIDVYKTGRNIYPPLSFVLIRLFSIHRCYFISPSAARGCDWLAPTVLSAFFCLNAVLAYLTYRRDGSGPALPRAVAVSLGLPMLYALQCGNLIIIAFTFFMLGYGALIRSPWLRALLLAVSINFKPYLFIVLIPPLTRRRWRWFAICAVASATLYGLTWAVMGAGSPIELLRNMRVYAVGAAHQEWSGLYYGTSYLQLIPYISRELPLYGVPDPRIAAACRLILQVLIRLAQVGAVGCLAAAFIRPTRVNARRFTAMVVAFIVATLTTGQSGYVQIFLLFLVFFEPWSGPARVALLVAGYLLCVPLDHGLAPTVPSSPPDAGVSVGQLVRPALLLIIQYLLIVLNFTDSFGVRQAGPPPAQVHRAEAAKTPALV
jgi:hypothetical protein